MCNILSVCLLTHLSDFVSHRYTLSSRYHDHLLEGSVQNLALSDKCEAFGHLVDWDKQKDRPIRVTSWQTLP